MPYPRRQRSSWARIKLSIEFITPKSYKRFASLFKEKMRKLLSSDNSTRIQLFVSKGLEIKGLTAINCDQFKLYLFFKLLYFLLFQIPILNLKSKIQFLNKFKNFSESIKNTSSHTSCWYASGCIFSFARNFQILLFALMFLTNLTPAFLNCLTIITTALKLVKGFCERF